jgi:hypothetical protein
MRDQYAYEGLNRLDETLNATGVLSDEYRRVVFGWTLKAVTEAYEAGRQKGDSDPVGTVLDGGELTVALAIRDELDKAGIIIEPGGAIIRQRMARRIIRKLRERAGA